MLEAGCPTGDARAIVVDFEYGESRGGEPGSKRRLVVAGALSQIEGKHADARVVSKQQKCFGVFAGREHTRQLIEQLVMGRVVECILEVSRWMRLHSDAE